MAGVRISLECSSYMGGRFDYDLVLVNQWLNGRLPGRKSEIRGSNPNLDTMFLSIFKKKQICHRYPALWGAVNKFLIAFPPSYLVKQAFSEVMQLLSKQKPDST